MDYFNIIIDVDDVILDNKKSMLAIISDVLGEEYNGLIPDWSFKNFGLENAEKIKKRVFTSELFKHSIVDELAMKYINKLKEDGHNIFFVTATKEEVHSVRKEQIREWFGSWGVNRTIITEHKNIIKADFMIDDAPHNIKDSICECKIIVARDWNNSEELLNYGIRLNNWEEIYNFITMRHLDGGFKDFKRAWNYLNTHDVFGGRFIDCMKIYIEDIGECSISIECAVYLKERDIMVMDSELTCYGSTFENTIINLANDVKDRYGDGVEAVEKLKTMWK